jgi:hypothetical protein
MILPTPQLQGGFENRKSKKIIESGLLEDPNLSRNPFESVPELRSPEFALACLFGRPKLVPWFGRVLSIVKNPCNYCVCRDFASPLG